MDVHERKVSGFTIFCFFIAALVLLLVLLILKGKMLKKGVSIPVDFCIRFKLYLSILHRECNRTLRYVIDARFVCDL